MPKVMKLGSIQSQQALNKDIITFPSISILGDDVKVPLKAKNTEIPTTNDVLSPLFKNDKKEGRF